MWRSQHRSHALRFATLIGTIALTALLVAGAPARAPRLERSSSKRPPAAIPTARPAPMIDTPGSLLTLCQRNELLRPACPRRLPAWGSAPLTAPGYYCQTAKPDPHQTPRQRLVAFAGRHCVFAEWDYTGGLSLPGWTPNTQVQGWDGKRWVADEFSMFAPPLHVGVQIQAARGSFPDLTLGAVKWPEGAQAPSDGLLGPSRTEAVSLGWVHWFGREGQLVLTPWGSCETGAELMLYLPSNAERVSYTITVDGWMSALRLGRKATDRVVRYQPGPALPHVVATLKAMFASAVSGS